MASSPARGNAAGICEEESGSIYEPPYQAGEDSSERSSRPRLFTFPSSRKGGNLEELSPRKFNPTETQKQWSKMDSWNYVESKNSLAGKRASIAAGKNITFAEREFLKSEISDNYDKLRSFSVTKKGQVIDCGYCYRDRHESPISTPGPGMKTPGMDIEPLAEDCIGEDFSYSPSPMIGRETESPNLFGGFRKGSSGRRCTCPDIWLTRAESFTPSSIKECDVWVTGMQDVGKSTLITQLCSKAAWDLEASGRGAETRCEQNGLSVSFLVDGEEILVRFREGSPAEVRLLRDENKPCAYLVLYTVDSRASFKRLLDILSVLLKDKTSLQEKCPVVIVGNKEDLQRRRVINKNEAKAVAKIYRCDIQEVSACMGLHMDELLKSLILQVQTALKTYQKNNEEACANGDLEESDFSRRPSFLGRLKLNGRRLVKSCEELFSRIKK